MTIDDEVRRAAKLLEALIQATGVSSEELEKRLDASPGYIRRLLSGALELKLRHILAILRILEIEPRLFFEILYPEAGPAGGMGTAPKPEVGMDDLERLVQGAVLAALANRKPED